ncbi:MAG: hypothetical protein MUP44_03695, partial [Anaerolineales bacterium]|nr:hypothetical protein [Anaerolineales bacterium]
MPPKRSDAKSAANGDSEYLAALERLERAQERMLSAAVAFCDGLISAGQLRAVRELLREQGRKLDELGGIQASPFREPIKAEPEAVPEVPEPLVAPIPTIHADTTVTADTTVLEQPRLDEIQDPELRNRMAALDQKIARLEQDFQQGRINASQYRAIYRHY